MDFQHNFALTDQQEIIWGFGYRRNSDEFKDTTFSIVNPKGSMTNLFSGFIQDQANLIPKQLRLTAGVKVEHNDFSGWEWQPSIRMLWTPQPDHHLWTAISRSVRTPSRGEEDAQVNLFVLPPSPLTGDLPTLFAIYGSGNLDAESVVSYEIGYRGQLAERFSIDATAFYNIYDNLITTVPTTPFPAVGAVPPYLITPLELQNAASGYNTGFELAVDWRPMQDWRLQLAYTNLYQNTTWEGTQVFNPHGNLNQVSLFSSWNLSHDFELDIWWRYVNQNGLVETLSPSGNVKIDPYSSLNLRLGWRPHRDLELSLVGANLFNAAHLETVQEAYTFPVEVEPSVYGQLKWNF